MSAPDPEKWQATIEECEELSWPGGAQALAELVARRRAIEELKALSESAMQEPNQLPICPVFTVRLEDIRQRIAAIEAEEA